MKGEKKTHPMKVNTWVDSSWSPVFLEGHNYETFSVVNLLKVCLILIFRHNLVDRELGSSDVLHESSTATSEILGKLIPC